MFPYKLKLINLGQPYKISYTGTYNNRTMSILYIYYTYQQNNTDKNISLIVFLAQVTEC